jgi:amino acid transporter
MALAGGAVMAVGMFNATLMTWSRLPVALAGDGLLPSVFARRARRTGAPFVAIGVGSVLVALSMGLGVRSLLQLDVLVWGLGLVLEFAALVALRVREPEMPRPFRVPGGLAGAVLLSVPPTALLALAAVVLWREPALGPLGAGDLVLVLLAAGVLWYVAARPRRPGNRGPGRGRRR